MSFYLWILPFVAGLSTVSDVFNQAAGSPGEFLTDWLALCQWLGTVQTSCTILGDETFARKHYWFYMYQCLGFPEAFSNTTVRILLLFL
jgi:hypothetical protein